MQVVTGGVGEGKSYSTLVLAELLDKHFTIDNVCFSPKEFTEAVHNLKGKGRVIIFDEAGILLSARKWWSITNMMINEVLQTFRYKNPIVFFVLPDFSFLDKSARKVVQALGIVSRRGNNAPVMRLHHLSFDRKEGKIYYPHPVIRPNGERKYKLESLVMNTLPSPAIVEAYETKAKAYKDKLQERNKLNFEAIEMDEVRKSRTLQDDIQHVIKHMDAFVNKRGKLDVNFIRNGLDISYAKAKYVKSKLEKMGAHKDT